MGHLGRLGHPLFHAGKYGHVYPIHIIETNPGERKPWWYEYESYEGVAFTVPKKSWGSPFNYWWFISWKILSINGCWQKGYPHDKTETSTDHGYRATTGGPWPHPADRTTSSSTSAVIAEARASTPIYRWFHGNTWQCKYLAINIWQFTSVLTFLIIYIWQWKNHPGIFTLNESIAWRIHRQKLDFRGIKPAMI